MKLLIHCWIFGINGNLSINEIEKAFKDLNINIDPDKLRRICKGLDFHEDEQIKYFFRYGFFESFSKRR